jgi:hypothetical protein
LVFFATLGVGDFLFFADSQQVRESDDVSQQEHEPGSSPIHRFHRWTRRPEKPRTVRPVPEFCGVWLLTLANVGG